MTTQETGTLSRIVWHDLMTVDLDRSKAFYGGLFGWTFFRQDMGHVGSYTVIQHRGRAIGGMVATDPRHGVLTHWLAYLRVDDVDDLCQRITGLGGKVAVEPQGVAGVGRFAILHDPQGGAFSAIQMAEPPAPAGPPAVGGFCWDQLLTQEVRRLGEFYGETSGWIVEEHEMGEVGNYGVFRSGDQAVAGMLPIARDDPRKPGWLVYVAVDDVPKATDRASELGGTIVTGPDTVPGIGVYAVVRDTTEGAVGLFKAAAS